MIVRHCVDVVTRVIPAIGGRWIPYSAAEVAARRAAQMVRSKVCWAAPGLAALTVGPAQVPLPCDCDKAASLAAAPLPHGGTSTAFTVWPELGWFLPPVPAQGEVGLDASSITLPRLAITDAMPPAGPHLPEVLVSSVPPIPSAAAQPATTVAEPGSMLLLLAVAVVALMAVRVLRRE